MVLILNKASLGQQILSPTEPVFEFLGKTFVVSEWASQQAYKATLQRCREYLDRGKCCLVLQLGDRVGLCFEQEKKIKSAEIRELAMTLLGEDPDAASCPALASVLEKILGKLKLVAPGLVVQTAICQQGGRIETFAQVAEVLENLAAGLSARQQEQLHKLATKEPLLCSQLAIDCIRRAFRKAVGPVADLLFSEAIEDLGSVERFTDLEILIRRLSEDVELPQYRQQFLRAISRQFSDALPFDLQELAAIANSERKSGSRGGLVETPFALRVS